MYLANTVWRKGCGDGCEINGRNFLREEGSEAGALSEDALTELMLGVVQVPNGHSGSARFPDPTAFVMSL